MHMKKETDYTLRIALLFCAAPQRTPLSLKKICAETEIGWQPAARVCKALEEKNLLDGVRNGHTMYYRADPQLQNACLLDLVRIAEGETDMMAFFSRETQLCSRFVPLLESACSAFENELKKVPLRNLAYGIENKKGEKNE